MSELARAKAMFKCSECRTTDGCEDHYVFACQTCGQPTRWSDGGDDERPNECSNCWYAWWAPRAQLVTGLANAIEAIFGGE